MAILQCIDSVLRAKSDHSIPDEFFHDILDEHFSQDEVERQFETAMNWGRYAEIFDHDPQNGRLVLTEPLIGSQSTGICGEIMKKGDGLRTISPYRLWSLLPQVETSHLPDLLMFAAAIALFYGVLVVARTWLGPVYAVG